MVWLCVTYVSTLTPLPSSPLPGEEDGEGGQGGQLRPLAVPVRLPLCRSETHACSQRYEYDLRCSLPTRSSRPHAPSARSTAAPRRDQRRGRDDELNMPLLLHLRLTALPRLTQVAEIPATPDPTTAIRILSLESKGKENCDEGELRGGRRWRGDLSGARSSSRRRATRVEPGTRANRLERMATTLRSGSIRIVKDWKAYGRRWIGAHEVVS